MVKQQFKRRLLAASIAAALAPAAGAEDSAAKTIEEKLIKENQAEENINKAPQDEVTIKIDDPNQAQKANEGFAAEPLMEEVWVTGIRGSLKRSMDIKREAKGIVDGISAEDIGKFPDTNLAESLQRISGVAIDRDRGEGSKITVRGFGPDFNIVSFNGRQMPTSGGRSFDFSNIASEGISAVEVYKSGRANVPTGGIGAVVNVITSKPLDTPGLKAVVSTKGAYDKSAIEKAEITPEFSGLYSNTFAEDTFGVALSFSYQEREGGSQYANSEPWTTRNFYTKETLEDETLNADIPDVWGSIAVGDPYAVGFPTEVVEGSYSLPSRVLYGLTSFRRERTNGQLTMQWAPTEAVKTTLDYTYAQNSHETEYADTSAWFSSGCPTKDTEWVQEGTIWSPTMYRLNGCGRDVTQGGGRFATVNENKSLGLNVEWQPTDELTLSMDYHDSSGEGRPYSKYGTSVIVTVASQNRIGTAGFFSDTAMPVLSRLYGERNDDNQIIRLDELSPDDMQIAGTQFHSFHNRMDVQQFQFDGEYKFESGHAIDFGIAHVEVENRTQRTMVERGSWSGTGSRPGDIADLLQPETIDGVFSSIPGGNDPRLETDYYSWDFDELIARGEALLSSGEHPQVIGEGGPCLTGYCPSYDYDLVEVVNEKSNALYVQGHMVFEPWGKPTNLFAGLRYEETDVHSEALVPLYDRVEWDIANSSLRVFEQRDESGDIVTGFTELDGDYRVLLPSIDFDIEVVEDVLVRASLSKTITRPVYNDLKGALVIDWIGQNGGGGRRGNPQLKPMESVNLDITAEWYYDEASYASVGIWSKDVDNFITAVTYEDQTLFSDLYTPIDGPLYEEAIFAITGGDIQVEYQAEDVNEYFLENFTREPGVELDVSGETPEITLTGQPGDPVATFDVTIPTNRRKTSVKGLELAVQHTFDDSGFGLQANYTIVDGDLEYDLNLLEDQWVVPGMSDTANLVGFYDKNGLQARIAINWRDSFLQGAGREPRFIEEYVQVDANVSYEFSDALSVFLEGINLTEEDYRSYGRSKYQVHRFDVGHARYNLGARYQF